MSDTGDESANSIALPAVADLLHASVLKAQLEQALANGRGIEIDGSAVRRITSPCLQILVAGMSTCAKTDGPSLAIVKPSASFLETACTLGLKDVLGLVGARQ